MDDILAAAHQGKDMIAQILDFTRDRPNEHTSVDLAVNLNETLSLLEDTITKEADLTLDIPVRGVMVKGSATGLHQVIANLAINALHAMKGEIGRLAIALDVMTVSPSEASVMRERFAGNEDKAVVVETEAAVARAYLGVLNAGRHARIEVTDTGSGMSAETLQKVFKSYFTTKPAGEGTGLGLAAVSGIVAEHHGSISVETTEGSGASFFCYLPLLREAQAN